jgi:hypothetical protein
MIDGGAITKTALDIILNTGGILIQFMRWFYLTFLPFIIQYIGIPLFVLGVILAVAFAGGSLIFIILFFIFMYFFIKGTIFDSKP